MRIPSARTVLRYGLAALGLGCFGIVLVVGFTALWTPGRSFDGVGGMVLGLVVPLALGGLLVGSSRWSLSRQVTLGATFCSAILVLFGFELYLARDLTDRGEGVETRNPAILEISARSGNRFDTRTHAEVVMALRTRGAPAVLNYRPKHLLREEPDGTLRSVIRLDGVEILPLGGIPDSVTVWCNETGTYTVYKSDAHGFLNPPHVWRTRTTQIGVVGNSFAMGACVPIGRSFVDHIRNVHPATLNLAMGHDGPLLQLATLKEYLSRARPRIVLWVYEEEHDLPFLHKEKRSPLLMRYLESSWRQNLMSRQPEIAKAVREEGERELRLQLHKLQHTDAGDRFRHLKDTVKLRRVRLSLDLQVWKGREVVTVETADLELLRRILRDASEATTRWGGSLVFVYLPERTRYAGDPSPSGKARDLVLDLVARLKLPVVDAHAVFEAHRDPLSLFPFRQFAHYTEEGQALVARQILRCLERRDFVRGSTICPTSTAAAMR